jgi:hypothetical protein
VTHHLGINEGKIDGFTLHFSFYALQGARAYDARLQLRRISHMFEKCDIDRRGEMWISIAFHLSNLPTTPLTLLTKLTTVPTIPLLVDLMRPFSFALLIASLAFALPVESVEHKLLTQANFDKAIANGYWSVFNV